MEGDVEGLVAIVQGLDDAGVTLTVMNRQRERAPRRPQRQRRLASLSEINPMPASNQGSPVPQSSVTETNARAKTTSTGAQICDGRYASSYRLAHCRVVPTSPPERVSEFPPQRREPCRNQGNFEVGGHGSGQFRPMSAHCRASGSLNFSERATVRPSKSNRGVDAFIHSLRKYPSLSPVNTASTDLIEKIIRCAQAKTNSPKSSRTTKSMRSLHKDRSSTTDVTKVSKHQQTYTRGRQSTPGNLPLGYKGRTKNFKLYSPTSDSRNIKYKDPPFDTNYDYLKAGSSRRDWNEAAENRLNEVSRYIRSTIRNMYNERPLVFQVCPKLRNRYIQHKRNSCPAKVTDSMINDEEDQGADERTTKHRSDAPTQSIRKSLTVPPTPITDIREPLKEEVTDVFEENKIDLHDNKDLEDNIMSTLEDVAKKGGDTNSTLARSKVRQSLLQVGDLDKLQAEDLSGKLVGKAREMSLIVKTRDSKDDNLSRISKSESGSKQRFKDTPHKDIFHAPEKIKIARKSKVGLESQASQTEPARLSQDLTDVIDQLPITEEAKQKLKLKLINMVAEDRSNFDLQAMLANLDPSEMQTETAQQTSEPNNGSTLQTKQNGQQGPGTQTNNQQNGQQSTNQQNGQQGSRPWTTNKQSGQQGSGPQTNSQPIGQQGTNQQNGQQRSGQQASNQQNGQQASGPWTTNQQNGQQRSGQQDTNQQNGQQRPGSRPTNQQNGQQRSGQQTTNQQYAQQKYGPQNTQPYGQQKRYSQQRPSMQATNQFGQQTPVQQYAQQQQQNPFQPTAYSTPMKSPQEFPYSDSQSSEPSASMQTDNPQIPSTQDEVDYANTVKNILSDWMNSEQLNVSNKDREKMLNRLTGDIVDRKKFIQINPKARETTPEEELEGLKYQVFRRMNKLIDVQELTPIIENANELFDRIMDVPVPLMVVPSGFRPREDSYIDDDQKLESDIKYQVNDWVDTLPVTIRNDDEKKDLDTKTGALIATLKEMVQRGNADEMKEAAKAYMYDIPIENELKSNDAFMDEKAAELVENITSLPKKRGKDRQYGMSFNGLTDFVDNWIVNIHIDDETKSEAEIEKMKKDIAYELIHKIGEMNVDPEIFNDEAMYEDVLRDELNGLLEDLSISDQNLGDLKEDLIDKVKEAQHRAKDEVIGQNYKRNLRNNISSILPDPRTATAEEQATMEVLKDQLADAFINLHFSGNDEELKGKLKNKISSEINKFCNDYLQSHPGESIDSNKLQRDLFNALVQVPLPPEDSMKYEVEQVRIRDEINEWVKGLPLEPQTPQAVLTRNKMIYVLSKKLFDIEIEITDSQAIPAMRKEIQRFLKKLPLRPGEDQNIETFCNDLIARLKSSEISRKYSESSYIAFDEYGRPCMGGRPSTAGSRPCPAGRPCTISRPSTAGRPCPARAGMAGRPSLRGAPMAGMAGTDNMCPYYRNLLEKQQSTPPPKPPCYGQTSTPYPPCTLNSEDVAHLERIRERSCLAPKCLSSFVRPKRSTGVGPRPIDAGSQTVLNPVSSQKANQPSPYCPSSLRDPTRTCPGMPASTSNQSSYQDRRTTLTGTPIETDSRGEVQPNIMVNEYYWDTPQAPPKGPEPVSQRPSRAQAQPSFPQNMPCDDVCPSPAMKSQRCPHCAQQKYYQMPQDKSSHGSLPCSRPTWKPWTPSINPISPPCQSTPLSSPGMSFRYNNENRVPRRDGLQDQTSCSRPYRKERVIELGSLDDLSRPRPKKRNDNNFDWSYAKFSDDDNFWGTPCMRRVILDEGIDEPILMEREKREERVRCNCKERLVPKCDPRGPTRSYNQPPHQSRNEESNTLKRCSKCCGIHCPYPSYLYFRQ